jgi:hypothetical protein
MDEAKKILDPGNKFPWLEPKHPVGFVRPVNMMNP